MNRNARYDDGPRCYRCGYPGSWPCSRCDIDEGYGEPEVLGPTSLFQEQMRAQVRACREKSLALARTSGEPLITAVGGANRGPRDRSYKP